MFVFFTEINSQDYNAKTLTTDNGLPSDKIYHINMDSKGFIWIGTSNGLVRWDSKNMNIYTIKDGLSNNEIISTYEDSKHRLWIFTFSNNLCYIKNKIVYNEKNDTNLKKIKTMVGAQLFEYKNQLIGSSSTKGFSIDVNDLSKIKSNNKYFVKNIYFKYKDSLLVFHNKIPDNFQLNNSMIRELYKSRNVVYKDKLHENTQFNNFIIDSILTPKYKIDLKKNNKKNYIAIELNNLLFVVTNDKCQYYFSNSNISQHHDITIKKLFQIKNTIYFLSENKLYNFQNKFISSIPLYEGNIYNIEKFKENNYFITTRSKIFKLNENLEIKSLFSETLNNNLYYNLKYTNFNTLTNQFLIGTGEQLFQLKNLKLKILKEHKTYCTFIDSKNRLWFSGLENLFYVDNFKDQIVNEKKIYLDVKNTVFIKQIKEDKMGNIVFCTNNGVYIYNPSTKVKYWLHDANLITSNECNRIEIDPEDNSLWISTFKGLNHIKYSLTNGKLHFNVINRFFTDDGLYANEINDFLIQGDSVWVATPKGLNLIHDKNNRPDAINIPIYINKLWVNDLPKSLDSGLKFNSDENNLTIDFSAIYYQRRDRLAIYYKLIRSGDTTVKYIKDNKLNLLALRDGDYQFQLYAYDQDYPYIHSELKTIQFSIQPPFYKAWWFWVGILFITSGIIAYLYYKKLIRTKNRELEIANTQSKLNEYSLKSLQNQMNPHFIFNSLNTIQHYITTQNEEDATTYLSQFSKLMREMLENTKTNTIALDKELEFNQRYVDLELMRYHHKFDVHFDINLDEDLSEIFIPNMLIQPLIENAIKHGVANLEGRKGLIKIKVQLISDNMLEIQIIDNGQGKNNKKMSSHASTATNVIYQRLELYTKNNTKGSFNITFSDNGTIAILILPI